MLGAPGSNVVFKNAFKNAIQVIFQGERQILVKIMTAGPSAPVTCVNDGGLSRLFNGNPFATGNTPLCV